MSKPIWMPSEDLIASSNITRYKKWLEDYCHLKFSSYDSLWSWSVEDDQDFWKSIWKYFDILHDGTPEFIRTNHPMPETKWFGGTELNYAEHIFRMQTDDHPAIIAYNESGIKRVISWENLRSSVAKMAAWLKGKGIGEGDRVAAYLPNIPEATVAFLATNTIGAVWSSCSPDFGGASVLDRFQQIEPSVLIVSAHYVYNGKKYNRSKEVLEIVKGLSSLKWVVSVNGNEDIGTRQRVTWEQIMNRKAAHLQFKRVPFDHPMWILYSSGTTGMPKAITHSQGGMLLEHLKYLTFHNDVKPGERFFWYTTTGWMMWNYVQAAMLCGATIVLYDGSPSYPDLDALWKMSQDLVIDHFGTSAPFLVACMKSGKQPGRTFDLSRLRSVSSTGAPLPTEAFEWVYASVKNDLWLVSMSGGTDVCTAFIGGVPTEPVFTGEIQKRALGVALYALDESGTSVIDEVGEMVISKAMPSMPVYFWNDPEKKRYLASYFEHYPGGIWRHGDWIRITPRLGLVVYGRSDATLNRQGIRIGTAEIYRSLDKIPAIQDAIIIHVEKDGVSFMPLFVVLKPGQTMDETLVYNINKRLRSDHSPRHVPDVVVQIPEVPYTISGKKLEAPVKKILMGIHPDKAANRGAMRNPSSLDFFAEYARSRSTVTPSSDS